MDSTTQMRLLQRAFVASTRVSTQEQMRDALDLIQALSQGLTETQLAKAKLDAEIELETVRPAR